MSCRAIIFIALLFCALFSTARPDQGLVRASVYDFFPMGDADNLDGEYPGMFYEMVEAILQASGLNYEINVEPIARTLARVKRGGSDLMIGLPALDNNLEVPIYCSHVVVVTRDDRIQSIADLEGARIGFVLDGIFSRLYGDKFGTFNEYSTSDFSLINMLNAGRIDGFMITKSVIDAYRVALPPDAILRRDWDEGLRYAVVVKVNQVYLQIPVNHRLSEVQRSRVVSSAYDLDEKGVFATILEKYGTEQEKNCQGK